MDCWEKFKLLVQKENLIEPGNRVLAAVSGGPDSVCLLHNLWRLKKTVPIEIYAVTINHGLRVEAWREIKKVEKLCAELKIPLQVESISVKADSRIKKISIETSARFLRYAVFEAAAKRLKCDKIATGHTANDNAETVLMWLVRGTGTDGAAGIPLSRSSVSGINIIRPLLSSTREEVMRYVKKQKLPYSLDKSNFSSEYTRNRIRLEVLPLLKKLNPCFIDHLFNFSQILARENEFINSFTRRTIRNAVHAGKHKIILDLKQFLKYNKAIQSRILKQIMPQNKSAANVEILRDWILLSHNNTLKLSDNWRVKRIKNTIVFRNS